MIPNIPLQVGVLFYIRTQTHTFLLFFGAPLWLGGPLVCWCLWLSLVQHMSLILRTLYPLCWFLSYGSAVSELYDRSDRGFSLFNSLSEMKWSEKSVLSLILESYRTVFRNYAQIHKIELLHLPPGNGKYLVAIKTNTDFAPPIKTDFLTDIPLFYIYEWSFFFCPTQTCFKRKYTKSRGPHVFKMLLHCDCYKMMMAHFGHPCT